MLKDGQSDVGLVFTTDGQIKAENLVLLEDDKKLFPPYNMTFLVKQTDRSRRQARRWPRRSSRSAKG